MASSAPIVDPAIVPLLWPESGGGAGELRDGPTFSYLVVPNRANPRFMLPRRRAAALAVLRHFRNDGTTSARRRTAALALAIRTTGGWPVARQRIRVSHGQESQHIEALVAQLFGPEATLGISLGPPRANRKPILQVLDRRLQPLALGKMGGSEVTQRLVATEAEALQRLAGLELPGIRIPELVHEGYWNDARMLFMSVLPLAEAEPSVPSSIRDRAMVTVARSGGTEVMRPRDADHLRRLRSRAAALSRPDVRTRVTAALDVVDTSERAWSFGVWHGDWTDWNMAGAGAEVLLWDWERHAVGVPLGWDALHYALRRAFLTRRVDVRVAMKLLEDAPRLLAPFGVASESARDVAVAYLIELAVRYTEDGQLEAGGRTARVEDWLLPVLPGR